MKPYLQTPVQTYTARMQDQYGRHLQFGICAETMVEAEAIAQRHADHKGCILLCVEFDEDDE